MIDDWVWSLVRDLGVDRLAGDLTSSLVVFGLAEKGKRDGDTGLFRVVDKGAAVIVFAKALTLEACAELSLVARMAIHMLEFSNTVSELAVVSVSIQQR
jgi:hypothetical protein